MRRIAITSPEPSRDETRQIRAILDCGWDMVHLRHPSASLTDMRRLIESIPQQLHDRLRLHGHFQLLNEFNLGGIQLNSRSPEGPANYHGAASRSCHTIDELARYAPDCDYMTLSPIFDSISKPGYTGRFDAAQLSSIPPGKVIALGGVTPDNVGKLGRYPFAGYAVLGYLFQSPPGEFTRRLRQFDNL
ncbi:MAG: thiamine phosphate synthase [Pseudoflavonifractor sp.]|nr:thiamine phosphate synthase [Pseudoflavonifractor sp.]